MDPRRRECSLAGLLDDVVAGTAVAGTSSRVASDPVWDAGLAVLRLVFGARWDDARTLAAALPSPAADDDAARRLHRTAAVWAAAGDPGPTSAGALDGLWEDLPTALAGAERCVAHLLVEGVLAHARLDLARSLVDAMGDRLWEPLVLAGRPHPFGVMAQLCRVRLLAFRGELAEAGAALDAVSEPPPGPLTALLRSTACLVRGNQADPADVRRLVAEVDRHAPEVVDHLTGGSQMLTAFGLIAIGDVAESARRVLRAGGDDGLTRLDAIDRALGLEMLLVLALAADDLDAAAAWADRAMPLLASPIADSTVARVLSRLALAEGRTDDAVAWGERAVARAREVDRVIERAEGEIVLARARILQRGEGGLVLAVRALEAMVIAAEERGHRAARRAASRELRPIGVRLRPLSGSGWAGLSAREAEVARLVVDGAANREVAARLHVSEHTVRAHVSRVLAAFGVATRAGLPAVAGIAAEGEDRGRPALTARQVEVARLVAGGLTNRAISDRLGVSPRTVEKHVGDILLRWDLPCRTAIAREVSASTPLNAV